MAASAGLPPLDPFAFGATQQNLGGDDEGTNAIIQNASAQLAGMGYGRPKKKQSGGGMGGGGDSSAYGGFEAMGSGGGGGGGF